MRTTTMIFFMAIGLIGLLFGCGQVKQNQETNGVKTDNPIIGLWIRVGPEGPTGFHFKDNGLIEGDFGNDGFIDVVAKYEIIGDTIKFTDKEGQMCEGEGVYEMNLTDYYVSFDLVDDNCGGRIHKIMGFWTKPGFDDLIAALDKEISGAPEPGSLLNRARIYLAVGKPKQARKDLDMYISVDTLNSGVYVNRAGTRFPEDMEGAVSDCDKALSIDPNNKNAYFLRGLARYELGEQEKGCEDFKKAIELGYSFLKIAEQAKCAGFWE